MADTSELAGICPLCGKPNLCALSACSNMNANAKDCWCREENFPELVTEKPSDLVNIVTPDSTNNQHQIAFEKRCICVTCLRKLQQQQ